jgi:hypothetical protein
LRHARRLAETRRVVVAVSVALAAAGLGAAASDLATAARLRAEADQVAIAQQRLRNEIGRLDATKASQPTASGNELAAWLDAAEPLVHGAGISPGVVLRAVADLLVEAPWARLETLAWEAPRGERDATLLPEFVAKDFGADSPSAAVIALEIALRDDAPPPRNAADTLGAHWLRLHGTPLQARVDADTARLRLHAVLPPPSAP